MVHGETPVEESLGHDPRGYRDTDSTRGNTWIPHLENNSNKHEWSGPPGYLISHKNMLEANVCHKWTAFGETNHKDAPSGRSNHSPDENGTDVTHWHSNTLHPDEAAPVDSEKHELGPASGYPFVLEKDKNKH